MDHTKLVMSLLLIVSGTISTLGSPTKDDDYPNRKEVETVLSDAGLENFPEMVPNREDLEAMLMRMNESNSHMETQTEMSSNIQDPKDLLLVSSDQGRMQTKRADPATVVAGATLGFVMLDSVLNTLGDVSRKVAIGVDNESGYRWEVINIYLYSGTSDKVMPYEVESGKALVYGARKSAYSVRGTVGVMTYYIPDTHSTLAIMFSVPYDYTWYSNWWDVRLYPGYHKKADYNLYYSMYHGNPEKGDHQWHARRLDSELYFRGAMSDSGKASLWIQVKKF